MYMRWDQNEQIIRNVLVTNVSGERNFVCETENPLPSLSKLFGYFLIENYSRKIPFSATFCTTRSKCVIPHHSRILGDRFVGFKDLLSDMIKNDKKSWSNPDNFDEAYLECHSKGEVNGHRIEDLDYGDSDPKKLWSGIGLSIRPDSEDFFSLYGIEISAFAIDESVQDKTTNKFMLIITDAVSIPSELKIRNKSIRMRCDHHEQILHSVTLSKVSGEMNIRCVSDVPLTVITKVYGYFLIENYPKKIPFSARFCTTHSQAALALFSPMLGNDSITSSDEESDGNELVSHISPAGKNIFMGSLGMRLGPGRSIEAGSLSGSSVSIGSIGSRRISAAGRRLMAGMKNMPDKKFDEEAKVQSLNSMTMKPRSKELARANMIERRTRQDRTLAEKTVLGRSLGSKATSSIGHVLPNGIYNLVFINRNDIWSGMWLGKFATDGGDFYPYLFNDNKKKQKIAFAIEGLTCNGICLYTIGIRGHADHCLGFHIFIDGTYGFHFKKTKRDDGIFYWIIRESDDGLGYNIIPFDRQIIDKKMRAYGEEGHRFFDSKDIAWNIMPVRSYW
uniref:Uncharacterized protein n=1 Tax=Corethron hystrix TaxID=216773 RepID=A0A7S1G0K7_9STRA